MTFEEALSKGGLYDNFWVWKHVGGLDYRARKHVFVVRTSDFKSTMFSCTANTYVQYIAEVPHESDLLWDYSLTDRSGDDWASGDADELLAWTRRLFL